MADDASSMMMSVTDTDDTDTDDNGRTSSIFLRSTTQKALKGNECEEKSETVEFLKISFLRFFVFSPGTGTDHTYQKLHNFTISSFCGICKQKCVIFIRIEAFCQQ